MTETEKKPSRRQQILEALAHELERNTGERITTAGLARAVGVSEAALYRHFPSKAKMFEGLIEFIEESEFLLVETMAEQVSEIVQREFHVPWLRLRIGKPGAIRGAKDVGVLIERGERC